MNLLNQLVKTTGKRKKRIGRGYGSGVGAKSTRGTTRHQKAREKIPIHFEGGQNRLVKRMPLLRGKAKNKSLYPKRKIIKLSQLNIFKADTKIDRHDLYSKKLTKKLLKKNQIKVLASGEINNPYTVDLIVSDKAKKLIQKKGGTVI